MDEDENSHGERKPAEKSANEEWAIQKNIEYTLERAHYLLQLRYQLAFGITAIIAGVWTILATSYGIKIANNLFIGWAISSVLILFWRAFTHIIFLEENANTISRYIALDDLGIKFKEDERIKTIEGYFNLKNNRQYDQFTKMKRKLKVFRALQNHIPEKGINLGDCKISAPKLITRIAEISQWTLKESIT